MNNKFKRIIFSLGAFVALVALACGGSGGGIATEKPPVTSAPPTKPPVTLPTEGPPTKPPIGGNGGGGGGETTITLASEPFIHDSGAFSITFPEGWETTQNPNYASATAPDQTTYITISFENAGAELSKEALNAYVAALEKNYYGAFANYEQVALEEQQDGSIGVLKNLDYQDVPYKVTSYYWQNDVTIYIQDWWVTADQYAAYKDGMLESINTMKVDGSAIADQELYMLHYTFNCPQQLCTFSIPYGWTHAQSSEENLTNDKFTAPDELIYVDNTIYDDGRQVTKSLAGEIARFLLNEYYAKDLVITDDKTQSDGSELLKWYSKNGGYSGSSFFETRGTTFLMLSRVANDTVFELYSPVWLTLLDSYKIP